MTLLWVMNYTKNYSDRDQGKHEQSGKWNYSENGTVCNKNFRENGTI